MARSLKIKAKDEQGFASILIALILIIVLALLTTGFTQVAVREQQDSLSDLLNSQAYYAAESGINDVANFIDINMGTNNMSQLNVSPGNCLNSAQLGAIGLKSTIGGSDTGVSYTCAIISADTSADTATIDVTGQARNVLKRLQADVDWSSGTLEIKSITNLPPVF